MFWMGLRPAVHRRLETVKDGSQACTQEGGKEREGGRVILGKSEGGGGRGGGRQWKNCEMYLEKSYPNLTLLVLNAIQFSNLYFKKLELLHYVIEDMFKSLYYSILSKTIEFSQFSVYQLNLSNNTTFQIVYKSVFIFLMTIFSGIKEMKDLIS